MMVSREWVRRWAAAKGWGLHEVGLSVAVWHTGTMVMDTYASEPVLASRLHNVVAIAGSRRPEMALAREICGDLPLIFVPAGGTTEARLTLAWLPLNTISSRWVLAGEAANIRWLLVCRGRNLVRVAVSNSRQMLRGHEWVYRPVRPHGCGIGYTLGGEDAVRAAVPAYNAACMAREARDER